MNTDSTKHAASERADQAATGYKAGGVSSPRLSDLGERAHCPPDASTPLPRAPKNDGLGEREIAKITAGIEGDVSVVVQWQERLDAETSFVLLRVQRPRGPSLHHQQGSGEATDLADDQLADLEHELESADVNLRASSEHPPATIGELIATTRNLQSTIERLHALNVEYRAKIHELSTLSLDVDHLMRSVDVAAIFLDRQLLIRKFTPAARESFKVSESHVGRSIDELSEGITGGDIRSLALESLTTGKPASTMVSGIPNTRHHLRAQPFIASSGQIEGVVLTLLDITELAAAQHCSRESHQLWKATIDSFDSNICVVDDHGLIYEVNAAWRNFAAANGTDPENVGVGQNYLEVCHKSSGTDSLTATPVAAAIARILAGSDEEFALEYPCNSPEEPRWFRLRAKGLTARNRHWALIQHTSITARKLNEVRLLAANLLLKESYREIEQLVSIVAHDLRSPLSSIGGFATIAKRAMERNEPGAVLEAMSAVEQAARRMNGLLGDLLDFAKLNQTTFNLLPMRLGEVIKESVVNTADLIASKSVVVSVADDFPLVSGERWLLRRVFGNLIANAAMYASTKPEPGIDIGWERRNDEVWVYVRDNGEGIPAKYLERVFEIFQRLNKENDGSGIGLTVVRQIMRLHGGRVWAESAVGLGTTVWLVFPPVTM